MGVNLTGECNRVTWTRLHKPEPNELHSLNVLLQSISCITGDLRDGVA